MSDSPWTPAYRIVEWDERYEVSDSDRAWKPGQAKRAGPLPYVRLKVHGQSWGRGFRKLQALANSRSFEVFGHYCKCLELAADNPKEYRGTLPNPQEYADICGCSQDSAEYAFQVMLSLGWISHLQQSSAKSCEILRNPASDTDADTESYADADRERISNHPKDEQELVDYCHFIGWPITSEEIKKLTEHYAQPGGDGVWRDRDNRTVPNWRQKVVGWRNNQHAKSTRPGTIPDDITPEEFLKAMKEQGL